MTAAWIDATTLPTAPRNASTIGTIIDMIAGATDTNGATRGIDPDYTP